MHFGKEIFVSIKKENINNYYEVAAKVCMNLYRNWVKEPSEPFIKAESKALKDHGEPLRRYQEQPLKTPPCL